MKIKNINEKIESPYTDDNIPDIEDTTITTNRVFGKAVKGMRYKRKEIADRLKDTNKLADELVDENQREAHTKKKFPAMKKMHLSECFENDFLNEGLIDRIDRYAEKGNYSEIRKIIGEMNYELKYNDKQLDDVDRAYYRDIIAHAEALLNQDGDYEVDESLKEDTQQKRYPIYFWNMLETAVNNMNTIPDEQKEEFITLVGNRAVPKRVPGYGYMSSKLPVSIVNKYHILPYVNNYRSFLTFDDDSGVNHHDLNIEQALQEIYDAMKNRWFPGKDDTLGESLKEDTIKKRNGKWTNRGDDGEEHGEFRTKKAADAQRKAMFANGYNEDLKEATMAQLVGIANRYEGQDAVKAVKDVLINIAGSGRTGMYAVDDLVRNFHIDEDIDKETIEDVELFINQTKSRFPGADVFYDGDSHTIKITLDDKEELTEDLDNTPVEAGAKVGLASIINDLIVDEYATINAYNSAIVTAKEEGFEDVVNVLSDIQGEENIHVGQLQKVMELFDGNANKVEDGIKEAEGQIDNKDDTTAEVEADELVTDSEE